jgi:2-octaprenyl-6-methoxyphenol hydroxylase
VADSSPSVAIVGGGPVGMTLALALQQNGVAVTVLEARSRLAIKQDPRVLALSYGSQQILQRLEVWAHLPATPIKTIHVSRCGEFGRARMQASDLAVPALGYVLPATDLIGALDQELRHYGISYRDNSRVVSTEDVAELVPNNALTIWAEGSVTDGAGQLHDYHQTAVLCSLKTSATHGNVAWERFTADGPLALLPLGDEYAAVFTCSASDSATYMRLDDHEFIALLQSRFGNRHRFVAVGPRSCYPLTLRWRDEVIADRQVWLGNAAQTLHPVAGQGFNLALRDVSELTRQLSANGAGRDPGAPEVLQAYAQSRRGDRHSVMGFTNGLIEVFGSELMPLVRARGAGLLMLDMLPPLRNFLARRMMFGARRW